MAAFRTPDELIRLRDVVVRTGLSKGTVYRILYTLQQTGFVEKASPSEYRLRIALPKRCTWRLGYDRNAGDPFASTVTAGLVEAARANNIEFLLLDNRNESARALRNADLLVRERVDLAIESQGDQSIADDLRARFEAAGIPLIAVDVPHPGALYFGANNYQAGVCAGREMGRWAKSNWPSEALDVVLIGHKRAGAILHSRVKGMIAGLNETRGLASEDRVFQLDSIGDYESAGKAMTDHLDRVSPRKTLVGAISDRAALGALSVLRARGLEDSVAVMGQNAEPEVCAELRSANSRMIGSVAYFPERYGKAIIGIARKVLTRGSPSPAVFTKHVLVTKENVDRVYPERDASAAESALMP